VGATLGPGSGADKTGNLNGIENNLFYAPRRKTVNCIPCVAASYRPG
jgi:hypothetical protein